MSNAEIADNAVTVGELRDILADYPQDALVIIADSRSNDFTPLESVEGGEYDAINETHGDFNPTEDDEDAVCLYPFE